MRRGQIPPPRSVKPEAPRPLEAICLKAMALKPEDRYATPLALAEEIEHWLADEPVSAWSEPWRDRARRWARRHRTAVTSAAVLLTATVLALTVATALISREKTRADANALAARDCAGAGRGQLPRRRATAATGRGQLPAGPPGRRSVLHAGQREQTARRPDPRAVAP